MIKAKGTTDDRETVFLGLAEENIIRLRKGEPILIRREEMSIPFDIMILWGKDHKALVSMLAPAMGESTKLRIGTLHGGNPPGGSKL